MSGSSNKSKKSSVHQQHINNQMTQENHLSPDEIKQEEINFLTRNIDRVRMASLKNK